MPDDVGEEDVVRLLSIPIDYENICGCETITGAVCAIPCWYRNTLDKFPVIFTQWESYRLKRNLTASTGLAIPLRAIAAGELGRGRYEVY